MLYRAAKADPARRFHALHDKVSRRDVLERAWELVRANKGAAGIDEQSIADVEQYGVSRLLDELAADLRDGRWRPLPARRVFIPKPGREELRPLSIPAVRDRVVQSAVKLVMEPVFEADFLPCSFGFRPKRSQHDALQVLIDQSWKGRRWVLETDIADCFEAIPHSGLMSAIEERVSDRNLLKLLRAMLRAGVMQDGAVHRDVTGTPQGGVVSPVLCNVYLHRLDRQWAERGTGVLVRFADDLVVMCHTKREAEAALSALRSILAEMGLEPKAAKTRIVHLEEGGEGLDFLGFHHRRVHGERGYEHLRFLARWPSREAMQRACDRIREITNSKRLRDPVAVIVQELNRFLRGWANYFRYGNSRLHFTRITTYALRRLALFVAKRHKRKTGYGMTVVAFVSPNRMGLVNLDGLVVTPRPFRDWRVKRGKPNAGGEGRR
ncbi:MAG: group II intron reverse transcriptase/maturase [Solirubrobacteraceae bacterium]